MKLLEIAPYVTIDSMPELTRNKTGFGYMVCDICAGLAHKNEVDVLLLNCQYEAFENDGIYFLKNRKLTIFRHLSWIKYLPCLIKTLCKYKMSMGAAIRLVYQSLQTGYLSTLLSKGKYDAVHIHGVSYINSLLIKVCQCAKVPFVVTLHGLNAFDESVRLEPSGKQYEKDFLVQAFKEQWPLTFISTGMKKRVMQFLNTDRADNIHVVCNSFRFACEKDNQVDLHKKYKIPAGSKIILYVGNQGINKNQKQIIRSFALLPKELRNMVYILFLGRVDADYNLQEEIDKTEEPEHLIMCGVVPKQTISNYYQQADATALLSITEGFGLSLIEGMNYGLPCIAINTMDAFDDIYDECAVIGVSRDDDSVAEGLQIMLTKEWNKKRIISYASTFSSKEMSGKYCNMLKNRKLLRMGGGKA